MDLVICLMRMPILNNVHGHEYLCTEEFEGGDWNFCGGKLGPPPPIVRAN